MDDETKRLEREFEAQMGQMKELNSNQPPEKKESLAGDPDNPDGEKPKELSSTELLMQRLAKMGALDENSAPPSSNANPITVPVRKNPVRKSPPRRKNEDLTSPEPAMINKKTDDSEAVSTIKQEVAGKPQKSKAELLAAKKAKFEAKMRKRAEERKRAAERRKNQAASDNEVSKKPKTKAKTPKKAPPPPAAETQEAPVDTGPSSTDLLMQRLAAMGVMDGTAPDAPPPSSGAGIVASPLPKSKPVISPKKTQDPPAAPKSKEVVHKSPAVRGEGAERRLETEAAAGNNEKKQEKLISSTASTEILRRGSGVMGMSGANADPAAAPKKTDRNKSPMHGSAAVAAAAAKSGVAETRGASSTEDLRRRMTNLDAAANNQASFNSAPAGERKTPPSSADRLRDRISKFSNKRDTAARTNTAPLQSSENSMDELPLAASPTSAPTAGSSSSSQRKSSQSSFSRPSSSTRKLFRGMSGEFKDVGNLTVEEVRDQFEAEHEILNLEVLETRDELEKERAQRKELGELLANTLAEYETVIRESNLRRADDVARIGLQDTELTQLREKVAKHGIEVKSLRKTNSELEANTQLLTESEQELSKQLDMTKKELVRSQELFEQLKKHAESKLQNAAKLYAEMQKLAEQKISESRQLTGERDQMRQKIVHLEKQLNTAQQNILMMEERSAGLTRQVQELSESSSSYKQQWFEANNGFQQAKQQNMELIAINDRYRVTITQLQEEKRQMESEAKEHKSAKEKMKALVSTNGDLLEENRALKSRIFDAMESEKQYKQRIETLKNGGASSGADDQIADLQQEVQKLKVQLRQVQSDKEKKDKENKELVGICDDLLNKLEIERKK